MRGGPNVAMNTNRACNHATLKACRGVEPRHRRHEILDERIGRMDVTIEANSAKLPSRAGRNSLLPPLDVRRVVR